LEIVVVVPPVVQPVVVDSDVFDDTRPTAFVTVGDTVVMLALIVV
jgi:hypothetical protein